MNKEDRDKILTGANKVAWQPRRGDKIFVITLDQLEQIINSLTVEDKPNWNIRRDYLVPPQEN